MSELPSFAIPASRAACEALDAADPLAGFRELFDLPADQVYLDGNSLGAMPRAALAAVTETAGQQWAQGLVRSWNDADWFDAPLRMGGKLAPILGAGPGEVAVCDSLSVNLFKLLIAALRLRPERSVVLTEAGNFPSDLYVAESVCRLVGGELRVLEEGQAADPARHIDDQTAVVTLTHVDYRTARMHDLGEITRRAHERGAVVLWNLAHSAGAVPLDLAANEVDLAVGCGYKYLNGGPGAPAFVYVARRLQDQLDQPLSGWFGHARPFAFDARFEPADGIARTLCGTPPMLAMAALEASLDMWRDVELADVRAKSVALAELFIARADGMSSGHPWQLGSPRDAASRGSHVTYRHPHGYAVMQALIDRGVVGDFRAPDMLRFGFTPLYTRYVDAWDAAVAVANVLTSGDWKQDRFQQSKRVT